MTEYNPAQHYTNGALPIPQNVMNEEEGDESDYDPTSYISNNESADAQPTSAPVPTIQSPIGADADRPLDGVMEMADAKKPRTVGGFMVDDDEDDDTPPPTSAIANHLSAPAQDSFRSATHTPLQAQVPSGSSVAPPSANLPATVSSAQAAAPSRDRVEVLEDRVTDDPRGDMDAWKELIADHQKRNKYDEARAVYDRFFKVFPQAVEQWVAYAKMELELEEFYRLEQIFTRTLMILPSVQLWSVYLDYVRRRQNLTTDASGKARQTITQAYDLCLSNVGLDKDSGFIWQDYVTFVKQGPGAVGGTTWQDQQKMDSVRKAYQKAVIVPMQAVNQLWQEYSRFETELNKVTGRKFLSERMPAFMTAKQSFVALNVLTKNLDRTSLPIMPPMEGAGGYPEYINQVALWKKWIEWESEDPLVLQDEDIKAFRNRTVYVYKHASMALRFWPQMWIEASDYCYANDMEKQGNEFLVQGMEANPESCLLAFKRADRLEVSTASEQGSDPAKRAATVRGAYTAVLDALLALRKKIEERGKKTIAQAEENFAQILAANPASTNTDEDDEDVEDEAVKAQKASHELAMSTLRNNVSTQVLEIRKTTTWVWITLIRAMRRILGKGKGGESGGGFRQVFAEARKKNLTADLYIECAAIEWQCYHDPAGTKILEKAFTQLFKEDETVALAYIKHLIEINDMTNAHAAFETAVSRFSQDPTKLYKAKPIYQFFLKYETHFGELAQVMKLEKRIMDLWPEETNAALFIQRFESTNAHGKTFDPTTVRFVISPISQLKPAFPMGALPPMGGLPMPTLPPALPQAAFQSPLVTTLLPIPNSPKRPFDHNDSDAEIQPARKLARGESPALKGAAGRRLEKRVHTNSFSIQPLPQNLTFFMSILPNAAASHHLPRPDYPKLIDAIRNADLSRAQQNGPGAMVPPQPVGTPQIRPPFPLPPQSVPTPNGQGGYPMPPQGFPPFGAPPPNLPNGMPFPFPLPMSGQGPPAGYGAPQYPPQWR